MNDVIGQLRHPSGDDGDVIAEIRCTWQTRKSGGPNGPKHMIHG